MNINKYMSLDEEHTAIFVPASGLPMWIQFFLPMAIGLISRSILQLQYWTDVKTLRFRVQIRLQTSEHPNFGKLR